MSERDMNSSSAADESGGVEHIAIKAPGAQLAACREQRGWTVEQVASQLNLAPRQIIAIESDNYASLPVMAVTRGFVRSYAKLLKIDPAPLLAALGGETVNVQPIASRKALATPFSEARLPSMAQNPGLSTKWVFGLLLVILGGASIWASRQGADLLGLSASASSQLKDGMAYFITPGASAQSPAQKAVPMPGGQGAEAVPAAAAVTSEDSAGQIPVPPVSAGTDPASAPVEQPTVSVASTQNPQNAQPGGTVVLSPALEMANDASSMADKNALVFTAREDAWVEIKRAENKSILFSRLLKAGKTETIELTEPVIVVIGNSDGIDVTLRGAPVEIKTSKSKVARLTLK